MRELLAGEPAFQRDRARAAWDLALAARVASTSAAATDVLLLTFLPHVGNLTTNVIVRSGNPSGTRGHMLGIHMEDVDEPHTDCRGRYLPSAGRQLSTTVIGVGAPLTTGTWTRKRWPSEVTAN